MRDANWHFRTFSDFAAKVQAISGVTPHLTMVGESGKVLSLLLRLWRGGCYAATYNFAAAEAIWLHWETPGVVSKNPDQFSSWVSKNWVGLPLRKERKAVNSPRRFTECLINCAGWCCAQSRVGTVIKTTDYLEAWALFSQVRFMGRYISIRFLEYLRKYCGAQHQMCDARLKGGKYPRQGLSLFYPQYRDVLLGGDSGPEVVVCNHVANACLKKLRSLGVQLSYYELQSLVCEYKQALSGRQYPVRALDSEIGYWAKVKEHFGRSYERASQFLQARESFAAEARGELQGWTRRQPLGPVLRDHGYNWSDLEFDYLKTLKVGDFSRPIRWNL